MFGTAPTPFGPDLIWQQEDGLMTALDFIAPSRHDDVCDEAGARGRIAGRRPGKASCPKVLDLDCTPQAGSPFFTLLPRDIPHKVLLRGSGFEVDVWCALAGIDCAERISYSAIARMSGHPEAVRAVASAVGRNPVSLLLPCHRVIRSDGSPGLYGWGQKLKADILAWEKAFRP